MLDRLIISNYIIITHLSIDFTEGLTVVTGETGAGKSILTGALGLILGDNPDPEAIRGGFKESVIEAHLSPPPRDPVWRFLAKHEGLSAITEGDLTIKRIVGVPEAEGLPCKDVITVNGYGIELPFLVELGTYLVEIHGQFANQTFLHPDNQLTLLDGFGNYPPGVLGNVAKDWDDIGRYTRELEEERVFFARAGHERPEIERVVAAIERIGLQKGEYEELVARLEHLIMVKDICELFQMMNAQLIAHTGIEMSLLRIHRTLATLKDEALDKLKGHIKLALDQSHEAILEMRELAPVYLDIDTKPIKETEEKLEALRAIATERNVAPEALFDHYEYLSARLKRIKAAPQKIRELDEALAVANTSYDEHATILSQERTKAAVRLSAAITAEMPPLKLMKGEAVVVVEEDKLQRTARGFNQITFTARLNPGMPFSPIAKTASGGELARLILAVKMILQEVQAVTTLVFDEVDTGIGGATAAAVGSRLSKLADNAQILVITHSPQVASRGDQHVHVSKTMDDKSTITHVEILDDARRTAEVARMLAGEVTSEEAEAAARVLLREGHAYNAARKEKLRLKAAQTVISTDAPPPPPPAPQAEPEMEKTEQ